MLIHICCSVDSHYFLQKIKKEYPAEKLVGFFYNPNIHPYSEYRLRLLDVQYSCDKLDIELIEGEYDLESWLKTVKGLENEPEKGDRCTVCFDKRLEVSAKKAKELGDNLFTTTLLISPKKSQDKLKLIGDKLANRYDLKFIFKDYRVGNGIEMQGKEVKKNNLYRQNYCGCMYGLNAQRQQQNRLVDELISPIGQQILPESIEERLELYKLRNLKDNSDIIKQRFLNYRLLSAKVTIQKEIVPSYFLCYSTLKNNKTNGRVEKIIDNIGYLNRDEVKIITLEYFNILANSNYKNIFQLIYNPIKFQKELKLRQIIINNSFYDLSCIVILDKIPDTKIEIVCNSKIYDDTKDRILL